MISFYEHYKSKTDIDKTEDKENSREGLKAYLVDDFAMRNINQKDEEFSNYAIHDDFDIIPEGEIWIAKRSDKPERVYYVDEALKRIHYLKAGDTPKKSYEKAIEWSKAHRGKTEGEYLKKVERKGTVHKKYIADIGKYKVYSIDARAVRDLYKVDFVEGGHGYVYDFIPKDEIWIESDIDKKEIKYILKHEYTELKLMRDKNMPYEEAHKKAAEVEYEDRMRDGENDK